MSNAHHLTMLDVRHLTLVLPVLVAAYYIGRWRLDKRYLRKAGD